MPALTLSASRTVAVPVDIAFEVVRQAPPAEVFRRRHGLMAAMRPSPAAGPWGGTVGQERELSTTDGHQLLERLTALDPPHSFGYRLTVLRGPLGRLVEHVDGRWVCEAAPAGVEVTWSWTMHPRGRLGALALPLLARSWDGYARKGLEQLEHRLLRS